jgi:hypothetical protein
MRTAMCLICIAGGGSECGQLVMAAVVGPIDSLSDSDCGDVDHGSLSATTLQLSAPTQAMRVDDKPRSLEIFSGSGRLSAALSGQGWATDQVELSWGGAEHDMSQEPVVQKLLHGIREQRWRYVHLAPPCNTYSAARYPKLRTMQTIVYLACCILK